MSSTNKKYSAYAVGTSENKIPEYPSIVTSSSTATATSTISYHDAYDQAYNLASSIAGQVSVHDSNVVFQAVEVVKQNLIPNISGCTGGQTGTFGFTGTYYSDYIFYNSDKSSFQVSSDGRLHLGINAGYKNQEDLTVALGN